MVKMSRIFLYPDTSITMCDHIWKECSF